MFGTWLQDKIKMRQVRIPTKLTSDFLALMVEGSAGPKLARSLLGQRWLSTGKTEFNATTLVNETFCVDS